MGLSTRQPVIRPPRLGHPLAIEPGDQFAANGAGQPGSVDVRQRRAAELGFDDRTDPAELLRPLNPGSVRAAPLDDISQQFKKTFIKRALGAEMSQPLGYAPGQAQPSPSPNPNPSAKPVWPATIHTRVPDGSSIAPSRPCQADHVRLQGRRRRHGVSRSPAALGPQPGQAARPSNQAKQPGISALARRVRAAACAAPPAPS